MESDKGAALILPCGRSEWTFLDCYAARFNRDQFSVAHFAGGLCSERGVFDVSRFAHTPPEPEAAVFAPAGPLSDRPVEVRFRWDEYRPGAFRINLPLDLPERFGARFNQACFGRAGDRPEEYKNVVTEPENDPRFLVKLINEGLVSESEPRNRSSLRRWSWRTSSQREERLAGSYHPIPASAHAHLGRRAGGRSRRVSTWSKRMRPASSSSSALARTARGATPSP